MERPILIKLEDNQIDWIIKYPGEKILELDPDEQGDEVVVISLKNALDLIEETTNPNSVENKKFKAAIKEVLKHFEP